MKYLIPMFCCLLLACGDSVSPSDSFDFNDHYTDHRLSSSVMASDSLSSGVVLSSGKQLSSAIASSSSRTAASISVTTPSSSSSLEASSSSAGANPAESSSGGYDYSHLFTPDSCVGLFCSIINPGELGTRYGVPLSGMLPDINGTYTHATIINGLDTPSIADLPYIGKLDGFKWDGTGYTNAHATDQRNYVQGSYQWNVATANNPPQVTYGGQEQIRDTDFDFVSKGMMTFDSPSELMNGQFLIATIPGGLVFVESHGRYAIEWRP